MAEFLSKSPTDMITEDEHLEEEANGNMNVTDSTFNEVSILIIFFNSSDRFVNFF